MSYLALNAQGTVIKIGDGASPETFTAISEIKDFNGPNGQATVIDVTDLSSVSKEKRIGVPDEGQINLTLHYIPENTQHARLRSQRALQALTNFQLIFTDTGGTTWDLAGYVTTFAVSGGVDGVITANVVIEISGPILES